MPILYVIFLEALHLTKVLVKAKLIIYAISVSLYNCVFVLEGEKKGLILVVPLLLEKIASLLECQMVGLGCQCVIANKIQTISSHKKLFYFSFLSYLTRAYLKSKNRDSNSDSLTIIH